MLATPIRIHLVILQTWNQPDRVHAQMAVAMCIEQMTELISVDEHVARKINCQVAEKSSMKTEMVVKRVSSNTRM